MHCDILNVARRRAAAIGVRGLLIAGFAAALAGCNTTGCSDTTGSIPVDYRERHPITIKEGKKSLVLFVGAGRGGLSPTQRAEVLAFAQNWKRDATGGVTIDRPVGGANERAANDTLKEALSILAQAGVPNNGIGIRPYNPGGKNATIAAQLSADGGGGRPLRAVARRPRPELRPQALREQAVLQLRLRHAAQPRGDGRRTGRPRAAARRNARLHRQAHLRHRQMAQGREPGDDLSRCQTRARSAIWANDQNRTSNRHA